MNEGQARPDGAIELAARDAAAAVDSGAADQRPPIPEPPPVRLVAVADVTLPAPAGAERALDALYIDVLKFEREDEPRAQRPPVAPILGDAAPKVSPPRAARPLPELPAGAHRGPVYRAENHRLCIEVHEPPVEREDLRPIGIAVPSLAVIEAELNRREIEHVRQKGLLPGQQSIALQDAAGNWLEIVERRGI